MLIRALPYDAPFWASLERAEQEAQKPTPDKIRERQAEFERRNAAARAKEAANG